MCTFRFEQIGTSIIALVCWRDFFHAQVSLHSPETTSIHSTNSSVSAFIFFVRRRPIDFRSQSLCFFKKFLSSTQKYTRIIYANIQKEANRICSCACARSDSKIKLQKLKRRMSESALERKLFWQRHYSRRYVCVCALSENNDHIKESSFSTSTLPPPALIAENL